MKINVLGFEPALEYMPKALTPDLAFRYLEQKSGEQFTSTLTAAVTKIDGWYAGVVLKSRDSTSFTKIMTEGGVRILKAEKLPTGHSLAEPNFFVAHPITGRGLYAYHYKSASMTMDFGRICSKYFDLARRDVLASGLADKSLTAKAKAFLRGEHKGKFYLSQLLNRADLKDFLEQLKTVSSFEANFTAFDIKEDIFNTLSREANRKSVKFNFPPEMLLDLIGEDLEKAAVDGALDDFWIHGKNRAGEAKDFNKKKNVMVFGEYDYDEMVGDIDIRFDDWNLSIEKAEMTHKLLGIAKSKRVGKILAENP